MTLCVLTMKKKSYFRGLDLNRRLVKKKIGGISCSWIQKTQTSGVDVKFTVITLSISIGNGILSGILLILGAIWRVNSNRLSRARSARRILFEITSSITSELYGTKSYYLSIVSITKCKNLSIGIFLNDSAICTKFFFFCFQSKNNYRRLQELSIRKMCEYKSLDQFISSISPSNLKLESLVITNSSYYSEGFQQ